MDIQLTGTVYEGEFVSTVYDGACFKYIVYVPQACRGKENCALLVEHDGAYIQESWAMEQLAANGEAPDCITVGVCPAVLPPRVAGGKERGLRMNNYDVNAGRYPDFLVEELIPHVIEKYDLRITPSPDMHLIAGGSSGGISAWNIAWRRNDYFRRVYMSSPSFLSMGRGEEPIELMRKFETKPIRVFTEYSENEPDHYFGSSYVAGQAAERALRFARYDMEARYYPGEGHCSRWSNAESAVERMRFLWKGWDTEPVRPGGLSVQADQIIPYGEGWEETDAGFPITGGAASNGKFTAAGRYTFSGNTVTFAGENGTQSFSFENLEDISGLSISSDKWRMYIGDKRRGCVYAASIRPDGSLEGLYLHSTLHMDTEFRYPGALDLCVDHEDRLYAATELGVQLVRSFGLIDVILENPAGKPAERIAIGEDGYLYARADGTVYRRRLKEKQPADMDRQTEPKNTDYGH